jgi:hypothetical protein
MTEYALGERDRWAVMQPVLSEEVIETWDERAPPEARSPEFGWLFSAPVERDARTHCRVYHGLTAGGQYYGALFEIGVLEEFDKAPVVTDVQFIRDLEGETYREQLWALARSNGGVVDEESTPDPMADNIPPGNLPRTHTISDRIAEKRVEVSA